MARSTTERMTSPGLLEVQAVRIRRDLKDTRFFYTALVAVLIAGLVLFAYLQMRLGVVRTGYDISSANSERAKLTAINNRLRLEQSTLLAPERIEKAARKLGLRYPLGRQIKRVR